MYLTGLVLSKVFREIGKISCAPTLTADIQNQINNVSPCITSKVAYQKLLKQLVKPTTAQKSLERMLPLEVVDWGRIICSTGQPRLSHRYHLFSIKY